MTKLAEQLIVHEGMKLKPYHCTAGKLTIGVGRNLDDVGISEEEAMIMLQNDIKIAEDELARNHPWVAELDVVRRDVLTNMVFNMGITRVNKFVKTLAAVRSGYYEEAATEMLSSRWADQVGNRAHELAEQMVSGQYAS